MTDPKPTGDKKTLIFAGALVILAGVITITLPPNFVVNGWTRVRRYAFGWINL